MAQFAIYIELALKCDGQDCQRCKGRCMRTWPDMGFRVIPLGGGDVRKAKADLLAEAGRHGWEDNGQEAFCPDCAKHRAQKVAKEAKVQKPGELQKPVQAGNLRKDGGPRTRCRDCSFLGTRAEQEAHQPNCPNRRPRGDDGPRRG